MAWEKIRSPAAFLEDRLGDLPLRAELEAYDAWWRAEGRALSEGVDRAGTPWVRTFDRLGRRVDEILYPGGYRRLLLEGYRRGVVWRAFESGSLVPHYLLGYVTAFHDPGLYCPYTVSLSTAVPLDKYGTPEVKARFLPPLLRRDEGVWQGATWMTEVKGGSDLGAAVETVARPDGDRWRLTGEKYFASNAGAELAVVAARPEGAPAGVRGLALFLLPKERADGSANYRIRRLKDKIGTRSVPTGEVLLEESEAYLLGRPEQGIYLILETLNLSRVANSVASVALAQRALAEAWAFAGERVAFGRPIREHPLLAHQFEERRREVEAAFALAWEAVRRLDGGLRQTPHSTPTYHVCRLVTHLAKYWTAEVAVATARWAMEVHGGMGVLGEYGVERLLREALILPIWEGTPHRQILDALEAMERKGAHRPLLEALAPWIDPEARTELEARLEEMLGLPGPEKEVRAGDLIPELARVVAHALEARDRAGVGK